MPSIDEYHGISKDDAVKFLRDKGYVAENIGGIVFMEPIDGDVEKTSGLMKALFKEADYRMSYGIRTGILSGKTAEI